MKIGVCGRSGSGKSLASKVFEDAGYFLLDLDKVGKDVVDIYPEVKIEIKKYFGGEVFLVNGDLDRKKLGDIVFKDKTKLDRLNSIFYRYIKYELLKNLKQYKNIVVDGAIIFDAGYNKYLDKIIYVHADEKILIARIAQREKNTDFSTIMNRLKQQKHYEEYKSRADYVFENNGSEIELKEKIMQTGLYRSKLP